MKCSWSEDRVSHDRASGGMIVVQVGVKMDIWARRWCQKHEDNTVLSPSSGCTIYPKRLVDIRATRETLSFLSVLDLGWSLSKAYKEEGPLEHLIKCAWVGWEIRDESGPGPVIYSSTCYIIRRTRFGGKLALLPPSVTLAFVQSFIISEFYNF